MLGTQSKISKILKIEILKSLDFQLETGLSINMDHTLGAWMELMKRSLGS